MTYQQDPRRPSTSRGPFRREDGSYSVLPILAGAALVIILGYMFLGDRFGTTVPERTPGGTIERSTAPAPITPSTTPRQQSN